MFRRLAEFTTRWRKESEKLTIELTESAKSKLRGVIMQPNPRLAELSFLGLGEGNTVSEILLVNDGEYSQLSGFLRNGFLGSSVDKDSDIKLWNKFSKLGKFDEIIFHGHSHPSGAANISGVNYFVAPSLALLEPSTGGTGNIQNGGDLAYYNSFLSLNPNLKIPNIAILANTEVGPKIKIFDLKSLRLARNYKDLDKVPSRIIDLD